MANHPAFIPRTELSLDEVTANCDAVACHRRCWAKYQSLLQPDHAWA